MTKYIDILRQYWGYSEFRALQGDIILSVAAGRDTLGLMPTGGGKSLTFQVPTMTMDGICLVITPLIALMKDQVDNLRKRRIKAAAVYSGMTREEIMVTLENCAFGGYKFLYISPERLGTELFLSRLPLMNVCLLAVDESHCISQWGYDFRPSYLRISEIREYLPDVPVLALTATATPETVSDIQAQLKFAQQNVFRKSFERTNLAYVVRHAEDKSSQLLNILNNVPGSGIVYVRNRQKTKEIADFLNENNIVAEHFHAGLTAETKDARQNRWKTGETRIMVSTNAFGMGIDKPDVRVVVHLDLPDSIEAYFQEAGRAGRDEKKAFAVLIYNRSDTTKMKKRLSDTFPDRKRIVDTYDNLGSYFQLAVGFGKEQVYPFNLNDFCGQYKLPLLPTYNALKILETAGYIELTEELDNPSRLLFLVKRDELYSLKIENQTLDKLIQVVLRSYTGLFTEYAHINEETIGKRLNTDRQTVYEQLIQLSKLGIVSYIPAKKTPFIVYLTNRVEKRYVDLPKSAYDDRQERYEQRTTAMLHYAIEENVCRSVLLLRYFGEKRVKPCGQCDVCLRQKKENLGEEEFEGIKNRIESLLNSKSYTMNELLQLFNRNEEKVMQVIRFLQDNRIIEIDSNEHLNIKKD